ncbi:YgaP-like transmembrane domain [sulfur-oxidizing endosymbiont of Gigantopelta aegis]|uniref:YgaP-like transmembrane domain n=1 Tax=sulfur-oxidizing endosymbiont of Gigantopelta aegis TaxID=2794934 RepID=UPI0018DC91CB|nr:YgaP-like transmembrane domain [sulfur-oxidizing endosymbiont of Gigantopelta aegis]
MEAERMMRFIVVLFLVISFFSLPDVLWFFPWYVAGMMIVSGISNICPMVMFLRWVGFR